MPPLMSYPSCFLQISSAPQANASSISDGKFLGLTKDSLDKPIVFIALATEPIFPG